MKPISAIILGLGLLLLPNFLHAQLLAQPFAEAAAPDSIVAVTAEAEGLVRMLPEELPPFGTYWEVSPYGLLAPLPCPPLDLTLPIYAITDDSFLVDATGGEVRVSSRKLALNVTSVAAEVARQGDAILDLIEQVQERAFERAMSLAFGMELEGAESFGGGMNSPLNMLTTEDYGTNLWIAEVRVVNGQLMGIGTNTLADVAYEIQSRTNLLQVDWQSEGFVWGASLTNWTPLSVAQNGRTNLFIRLKSWADDGSGLPLWWQQQYFGTNGVDPYGDSDGDGWSNLQEFQNGTSPFVFNTPAAPKAIATLKANKWATLRWQAAPGPVTGYRIERGDSIVWGYNVSSNYFVSADTFALEDNLAAEFDAVAAYPGAPEVFISYAVHAQYAGGESAPGYASVENHDTTPQAILVNGPSGKLHFVLRDPPSDLKLLRVYREEQYFFWYLSEFFPEYFLTELGGIWPPLTNGFFEIPSSQIANGICQLPDNQVAQFYGELFWAQTVRSNGVVGNWSPIWYQAEYYCSQPFWDLRRQMKDNLTFLLRAAPTGRPFTFSTMPYYSYGQSFNPATNEVSVDFADEFVWPANIIEANAVFRNFVFDPNHLNSSGRLNTGVYPSGAMSYSQSPWTLTNIPTYCFDMASLIAGVTTNIPASLLATNQTRWILPTDFSIAPPFSNSTLRVNQRNFYGLPYVSAAITRSNNNQITWQILYPEETGPASYFTTFLETAQPVYQLTNYYFCPANAALTPGRSGFASTNVTQPITVGVGERFALAGYAKFNILNSTSNRPAYLGQYFDGAYKVDANGTVTTNATGVLSPYGHFLATEPGDVALVTMPDLDTGTRGTNIIHCVGINLDKNHDGIMDLKLSGSDTTWQSSPMVFWVNNDYDRGHTVDGNDFEQDDLGAAEVSRLSTEQRLPDCEYTTNGLPAIPSTRDLEDYFRLWTPGVAAAMRAIPTNHAFAIGMWGDAEIRLFQAEETEGGTNYLFNSITASNQVAHSKARYLGTLKHNEAIFFDNTTNFNEHFIACGSKPGQAEIYVSSDYDNGQLYATAFVQIKDIKEMYERWTVGDDPRRPPLPRATNAVNDLTVGTAPFNYAPPTDTNTPYILHVHGWNMEPWEKDRFAETAFKRLYWQGYQGRFGSFRWPTFNGWPLRETLNSYDKSEFNAWYSGAGLRQLLADLNATYPDQVRLTAHSMGNVVAGEALRTNNALVQVYVAMQAAVPAGAYDLAAPFRSISFPAADNTPELYRFYPLFAPTKPYFSQAAGAAVYINFFNQRDFALNAWLTDQNLKPADSLGYSYTTNTFFQFHGTARQRVLTCPTNTFELFAYCVEGQCWALGAQTNVSGVFDSTSEINLNSAPYNYGDAHKFHSAQFRADNASRANFWERLARSTRVKN